MSTIPFTYRELKRAWNELAAAVPPDTALQNTQRLLLFYAVECGLKVVWLKRLRRELLNRDDISKTGHNLRQLLKDLNVGSELSLPESFQLKAVTDGTAKLPRNGMFGDLHQVWRYGGTCEVPTDQECENKLKKVLSWIEGELK